MKKLTLAFAILITVSGAAAQSFSADDIDPGDLEEYREKINQYSDQMPDFLASIIGDQTINVRIDTNSSRETVGIKMNGTRVQEVKPEGYENSTLEVNTNKQQIRNITSSENPVQALNTKLKNGDIEYDSEGYVNTIRTFIARQLLKLVSLV